MAGTGERSVSTERRDGSVTAHVLYVKVLEQYWHYECYSDTITTREVCHEGATLLCCFCPEWPLEIRQIHNSTQQL